MNKIKEYFTNVGYASKIIWTASKKYFILKFILSLISSVLPYLPLFLWRELINALVEAIGGNAEPLVQKIWWLTMLYCAVMLIEKLLDTVSNLVSFKYNDSINYYLDNAMIDKVSAIDLAFFDSSDLNDKLDNAWDLMYSTKNMVSFVFDMLQRIIRLIISFSLVLTLSLWLVPVVIILCIPSVIGDRKVNDMNYRFEIDHTKSHRKLEYYKDLFFEGACSEVRLYHLRDYFSSLYTDIWKLWDKAVHAKNVRVCLINIASLILLTVNEVIVYILSVVKLIAGEIAVGDVAYYVSLLTQFRQDFTSLCYRINMFSKNTKELNEVDMDNINNLILQKRKERGLTQSELGAMLGISGKAVSKWERGLSVPCEEHLEKLIDLLGLPVEQKIAESELPSTFLSTVKSELIRILSAGVMIAVCICNWAGIISTDSTAVSLGFSAALFCFGTMIKG